MKRAPRLAMMLLPGLDHFTADILARLPAASGWEVRPFRVTSQATLAEALAWLDDPGRDAIWFEFCWPPFPQWIAETDFGDRRVIVRVHRIEAVETDHVAKTSWDKVSDVIVVSPDMRGRVLRAAPEIEFTSALHLVPNGVDTDRFKPAGSWNPYRIGWCGLMTLRKNPILALQIFAKLRAIDHRYQLHLCGMGGEQLAEESFLHLGRQLGLERAIHWDGRIAQGDMPGWHAANGVLLHTSLHEGLSYAILEAAASGCDLAVFDYPGAEDHFSATTLFRTIDEAITIICRARQNAWRDSIGTRYSLAQQVDGLAEILQTDRECPALMLSTNHEPDVVGAPSDQPFPKAPSNRLQQLELRTPSGTVHFIHRGTRADLAALHQCFTEAQYDVQSKPTAYGDEINRILADMKSAGKTPLIVDCGANIGASVAWFATKYPDSQIVAVEPARDNLEILIRNAARLQCEIRGEAISAEASMTTLTDPGRGSTAYRTEPGGANGYTVKAVTLMDILSKYSMESYSPFMLKIDIEGHEDALFSSQWDLFDKFPFILIELHDWLLPGEGRSRNFFRFHTAKRRETMQNGETFISISNGVLTPPGERRGKLFLAEGESNQQRDRLSSVIDAAEIIAWEPPPAASPAGRRGPSGRRRGSRR